MPVSIYLLPFIHSCRKQGSREGVKDLDLPDVCEDEATSWSHVHVLDWLFTAVVTIVLCPTHSALMNQSLWPEKQKLKRGNKQQQLTVRVLWKWFIHGMLCCITHWLHSTCKMFLCIWHVPHSPFVLQPMLYGHYCLVSWPMNVFLFIIQRTKLYVIGHLPSRCFPAFCILHSKYQEKRYAVARCPLLG